MYIVNTSWLCKAMKNLIVNKSWGWAEAVVSVSLTLHKQQTVLLRGCHETLFIIWMKIEASVKGSPVQAKACWRRTQSLTSTHWTTIHNSSLVFIHFTDNPLICLFVCLIGQQEIERDSLYHLKGSPVQAKACWRRTQSFTSTHWTTIHYSSLGFIVSLTTLSLHQVLGSCSCCFHLCSF